VGVEKPGLNLVVTDLPSGKQLRRATLDPGEAPDAAIFADDDIAWITTSNDDPVLGSSRPASTRVYRWTETRLAQLLEEPHGKLTALAVAPSGARLAALGGDGAIRVVDTQRGRVLANLATFRDDEWIAYTPGGAYRGTAEVAPRVAWVFDTPSPEPFGFEQFARVYERPDIVEHRLSGEDVDAPGVVSRPPSLHVSGVPDTVEGPSVHGRIHVESSTRVEEVRVLVEGREAARRSVCAANADIDLDVPLLPGTNRVTFYAYDAQGLASNAVVADVTSRARADRPPDLWVVALGVSRYPNLPAEYQLANADADARGVAAAFEASARGRYGRVHSTVLVNQEVTVDAAKRAIGTLAAMEPGDLAVVFLAGHGVKPSERDDMVFLTAQASATRASLPATALAWGGIRDALGRARGRVIVLLDACHSGHVSQDRLVPNDALAASLEASGRTGALVFSAAKGRQVSFEAGGERDRALVLDGTARGRVGLDSGTGHGFFSGAVIQSLASPATDANGDGEIEMSELVADVTARVRSATGDRQTPWVALREIVGDFSVVTAPPPRGTAADAP
jgi:hypothetical protein